MINHRRQSLKYVLTDWLSLNLGWFLFTMVRYSSLPGHSVGDGGFVEHLTLEPVLQGQIIFPFMMVALYWLSGYYNVPYFKSRLDDILNTVFVNLCGSIIIFFVAMVNDGFSERSTNITLLLLAWLFLTVPVYISRSFITHVASKKIHSGEIAYNTLVVGTGRSAIEIARRIDRSPRGNGFRIMGLVELSPEIRGDYGTQYEVSSIDDIRRTIADKGIERLIIVPHRSGMKQTSELISYLMPLGCEIFATPDLYSMIVMRPRMQDVVNDPLVDISSPGFSPMTANMKRTADVVLSSLALLVFSPLYLALALAVKIDSPGPAFYRQLRIGYHKKPFYIYKFRSMYTNSEADGPKLSAIDDPRITRVGRFLRKYRLDEFPQFWNVLKGDMSIVGPRPEREYYVRQIVERMPYYTLVHRVRPGITSWGMVKYGYASNIDQMIERLRYDLLYLENVSMGVDLKILFHTVRTVITGRGI